MARKSFALEDGGTERLTLNWQSRLNYARMVASFDGVQLNEVPFSEKDLAAGQQLTLPDASQLALELKWGLMGRQLEILRDGLPLPGSASHPRQLLRSGAALLWVVSALGGLAAATAYSDDRTIVWDLIVPAVVFAVLGLLMRLGLRAAAWGAVVLWALFTTTWFVFLITNGGLEIVPAAIRIWILAALVLIAIKSRPVDEP